MGFSGAYIRGHSGTQQKHRKVFENIKRYKKKIGPKRNSKSCMNDRFSMPENDARKFTDSKLSKRLKLGFISIILISLISSVYVISTTESINVIEIHNVKSRQIQKDKIKFEAEQKLIDYNYFVESGFSHLKINNLNEAQWEFVRALYVDEYGINARIGLLKVLEIRCEKDGKYCAEAEENRVYLNEMKIDL